MSNRLDELNEYIASLSPEERAKHEDKLNENPRAIFDLIEQGDAVSVAIALENGIDRDITNSQGMRPLHVAAMHGTELIVLILITHVSDAPWEKDNMGRLPLDVARECRHTEIVAQLEQITYPKQFLELTSDSDINRNLLGQYSKALSSNPKNSSPPFLEQMQKRAMLMRIKNKDNEIEGHER